MKKNILYALIIIILLLIIVALFFTIVNLRHRPRVVTGEEKHAVSINTDFSKYGITPKEAMHYE